MKKNYFTFETAMVVALIVALLILLNTFLAPQSEFLEQEAEVVLEKLTNGDINILSPEGLSVEKVKVLDRMEYGEVKSLLGVESNFCIYFEDATGNVLRFDNVNLGIGSDNIYVNGEPCR